MIRTCSCTLPWTHGAEICDKCSFECDEEGYVQMMPIPKDATIIFDDGEVVIRTKKPPI